MVVISTKMCTNLLSIIYRWIVSNAIVLLKSDFKTMYCVNLRSICSLFFKFYSTF